MAPSTTPTVYLGKGPQKTFDIRSGALASNRLIGTICIRLYQSALCTFRVAYCVAPLRPLLVRQLFKTLLRCSPDADQHAVLTKEPNALLEMLADGPMNFDSASHVCANISST